MQKDPWAFKGQSVPMDEWILHTKKVETLDYSTEAWVGEAISNGLYQML